jgi:hypothetical protein
VAKSLAASPGIEVGAPTHHNLTGMKHYTVEYMAGPTYAALVTPSVYFEPSHTLLFISLSYPWRLRRQETACLFGGGTCTNF